MYATLKFVHIIAASLTICGFVLRGAWMLSNSPRLERRAVRIVPHVIDTLFLATGVALIWTLKLPVLHLPWLIAKLIAIVVYIGLGMVALRLGRTMSTRIVAFALALAVFAYIVGVALSKSVASWLALVMT